MSTYIFRRLLITIPVLFGIILAVFIVTRILPGSACFALMGERATQAACAAFDAAHGLDRPIPEQFVTYVTSALQGDLGTSFRTSRPVGALLVERIPMTLELGIYALLLATVGGITLGIVAAARRNSSADVLVMAGANVGVSIPIFVLGLLLVFVFANLLKDTPVALPPSGRLSPGVSVVPLAVRWGMEDQTGPIRTIVDFVSNMYTLNGLLSAQWDIFSDAARHLILPGGRAGHDPAGDHRPHHALEPARRARPRLRPNRSREGRGEGSVLRRHALRNAMLPIVTVIGLQIGALLSGAVLTETIFLLPGVGSRPWTRSSPTTSRSSRASSS
jgi:ABC-type dipeptide/oligopeptide/nickel transport system permease component